MGIQAIIPKLKTQETIVFHTSLFSSEDKLILAPMQNLTSLFFRKTFSYLFPQNFDYAVSPFISVSSNAQNPNSIQYKDISPTQNRNLMPLVPQILGNKAEEIVECAKILERFGYREVNLNMGCPKKDIVSRGRGSGLLKDKDAVKRIFDAVLSNTTLQLSIKVRLGIKDGSELETLLPILNDYPLKSVTIHPRTQQQQYLGEVNLSDFAFFATKLKHTIIYNGDIFSTNDFKRLKTQFPFIKHWMIGRGVLQNPFLAAEIRGISYDKKQLLPVYIDLLQENFIASLYRYNETTILNKMKEFTKYLSIGFSFDATELLRMDSLDEFNKALHKISV